MTTMRNALARLTSQGVPFSPETARVSPTSAPLPAALLESQHTLDTLGEMILLPDTKEAWYSAAAPAWAEVAESAPESRLESTPCIEPQLPVTDTFTMNESSAPHLFQDRLLELPVLGLPPQSPETEWSDAAAIVPPASEAVGATDEEREHAAEDIEILPMVPGEALSRSQVEPAESEWKWDPVPAVAREPSFDRDPNPIGPDSIVKGEVESIVAAYQGMVAESTFEPRIPSTDPVGADPCIGDHRNTCEPMNTCGTLVASEGANVVEESVAFSQPESPQLDGAFELAIRDHLRDMTLSAEYDRAINLVIRRLRHGCGAILIVHGPEEVCSSETIAHLACLLTSKNRGRILLVDADLAARRISQGFGLESSAGLTQVLKETSSWLETVETRFDPLLSIVPAGPVGTSAAIANWEGPRVRELVDQWREHHEIVLIDGGNLAANLAIRLSQAVDVSLLAVRLGETSPLLLQDEVDTFRAAGGRLHACLALHRPDGV